MKPDKNPDQETNTGQGKISAEESLLAFPLLQALFGRRARRFGLGMEIPSGPLAYKSDKDPLPLSEREQMILVAAATGVSGWNFGVPFGPRTPQSHAEFTLRYTGRTAPTAAGLGTTALFFTDDSGCYFVNTRDLQPASLLEMNESESGLDQILSVCRKQTVKISDKRLDLPSQPPHLLPPNLWWANKPGSTIFMPVADAAEECLGLMALMIRHGVTVIDHETGKPAGNLDPFFRSGLLDPAKQYPLSELQSTVSECICLELAFMGHNIVLMLQAMGLGGLFFNGVDDMSAMGANAETGNKGLGFRFERNDQWITPNSLGLPGIYEALSPPNYADMRAAVETFVERKFGSEGAYNADKPGPWKDSAGMKSTVKPYEPEFVDCITEVANYIYEKHGKFPGIRTTIMMPGFVQAHHLDTGFYDTHYKDGAYLETHANHMKRWH